VGWVRPAAVWRAPGRVARLVLVSRHGGPEPTAEGRERARPGVVVMALLPSGLDAGREAAGGQAARRVELVLYRTH